MKTLGFQEITRIYTIYNYAHASALDVAFRLGIIVTLQPVRLECCHFSKH